MNIQAYFSYIGRACRFAAKYGPLRLFRKANERRLRNAAEKDYPSYLASRLPDEEESLLQREASFSYEPLISVIVPAYETEEGPLREMISSVLTQSYARLELCIADGSKSDGVRLAAWAAAAADGRLKYIKLKENKGISGNTNAALSMASGDYVGLLDHDDFLLPGALYQIVKALNEDACIFGTPADAVYTDEDKYDTASGTHFQPHFKPDFNLEYLRSNNYICHFFMVKREIAARAGGFNSDYDGAQDHDFIFRCTERGKRVLHVPEILYSWRSSAGSTATNPESKLYAYEAGKRAVAAHLERMGVRGTVSDTENHGFYRVTYPGGLQNPGKAHENFDRQTSVDVVYYVEACNNSVTISGSREYILFVPYKKMKVNEGFLEELTSCLRREGCFAACAKVYGPDKRLTSDIRPAGLHDPFSSGTKGLKRGYTGYFHAADLQMELETPTDCFLIRRSDLSGDIFSAGEFALRVRASGGHIYYEPRAVVYGQK